MKLPNTISQMEIVTLYPSDTESWSSKNDLILKYRGPEELRGPKDKDDVSRRSLGPFGEVEIIMCHILFFSRYYTHSHILDSRVDMLSLQFQELGVTTHPAYKIMFMIDSGAMITLHTDKYGIMEVIHKTQTSKRSFF